MGHPPQSFCTSSRTPWKGCAPSFSAHVRHSEHRAPHPGKGAWLLELDAYGKLKGSGSAGAEESACRADGGIEVGLHGLRGLAVLCRLVRADGDITPRIIGLLAPRILVSLNILKPSPIRLSVGMLAQAEVLLQPQIERTEWAVEIDARGYAFERAAGQARVGGGTRR